jgi:hypothetical protein
LPKTFIEAKRHPSIYAIFCKDGKQVKRSLKTSDPELAKRKLKDTVERVDRLDSWCELGRTKRQSETAPLYGVVECFSAHS